MKLMVIIFSAILIASFKLCFSQNNNTQKELELKDPKEIFKTLSSENGTPNFLEFIVPIGKMVKGFNFSNKGELTYNGKSFVPALKVNINNINEFKVSLFIEKKWAGAISVDMDGQNALFFLDLDKMTATPMQSGLWNAAQEIYWSPSQKYMVALCAYEGERFVSINTLTKKVTEIFLEKPNNNNKTIWQIKGDLNWLENNDVLVFEVEEYCNPYEVNCGEGDKVLATYKVNLNVVTLSISFIKNK